MTAGSVCFEDAGAGAGGETTCRMGHGEAVGSSIRLTEAGCLWGLHRREGAHNHRRGLAGVGGGGVAGRVHRPRRWLGRQERLCGGAGVLAALTPPLVEPRLRGQLPPRAPGDLGRALVLRWHAAVVTCQSDRTRAVRGAGEPCQYLSKQSRKYGKRGATETAARMPRTPEYSESVYVAREKGANPSSPPT